MISHSHIPILELASDRFEHCTSRDVHTVGRIAPPSYQQFLWISLWINMRSPPSIAAFRGSPQVWSANALSCRPGPFRDDRKCGLPSSGVIVVEVVQPGPTTRCEHQTAISFSFCKAQFAKTAHSPAAHEQDRWPPTLLWPAVHSESIDALPNPPYEVHPSTCLVLNCSERLLHPSFR